MKHVCTGIGDTSGCCGVAQWMGFSSVGDSRMYGDLEGRGETVAEAYQDLFNKMMAYDFEDSGEDCAVVQIWFYKGHDYNHRDNDAYEAEELRLLVEAIPNVRNLGEYRNPNTNNLIQGYQWAVH